MAEPAPAEDPAVAGEGERGAAREATADEHASGAVASTAGGAADPATGTSVRALQRRLAAFAAARDWQPFHTPKNLAAALSVEAAELLEIFQWLTPEESARVMDDPRTAARVTDEVADVLAYLLQFCEALGVDPLVALSAKIERNEQRFPVRNSTTSQCHSR